MGVAFSIFELQSLDLMRIDITLSCKNTNIFVMVSQVLSELANISVSVLSISEDILELSYYKSLNIGFLQR